MQKHTREIVLSNTLTVFNAVNAGIIALLYAALQYTGDSRLLWDGLGVGISSVINTAMSIVQEYRAHKALEKISVHVSLPAKVLRAGTIEHSEVDTLKPGDVVRVMRGDVVPADGTVISTVDCQLDTSMLTGESEPFAVNVGSSISGGSFCVSGQLDVQLTADRAHSLSGRIESHAQKLDLTPSPLQKNVNAIFVWSFAIAGVFAVADLLRNPSSMLQDVDSIRRAATLVLGLIPESLILLSTITFIIGTIRIRKLGIIVQRLAALESFSQATDVCFDKTGTLTTNELEVDAIISLGADSLEVVRHDLHAFATALTDESQIMRALRARSPFTESRSVLRQTSFSSITKFSALHFDGDEATLVLGAPEVVCTPAHPLWKSMQNTLAAANKLHHRSVVLARSHDHDNPCGVHTEPLCWVVFNDTLRHDAQSTIAMFHAMNITTHLLTGDKQDTAEAVVAHLGIPPSMMSIHARCTPEDKYEIVHDLCSRGHVIMIGDGINDIPALRRADVGVAPSQSSPATKLVADIVLEQGGFADFPAMIDEGRTAVRTVLTVSTMFLVKNALLVLLTLGSWLLAMPYVLSPRRGALLSIIGIVVPSICASLWPQRGIATTRFFAELWQTMIVGTLGVMLSYLIATQLYVSHEHFTIIAVFSLLSSLLTIFVLGSRTFMLGYIAVSIVSLVIVSLLMTIPASLPILSIVQLFYEIGGAGTSALLPLFITGTISIAVTSIIVGVFRWVVLPRYHRS